MLAQSWRKPRRRSVSLPYEPCRGEQLRASIYPHNLGYTRTMTVEHAIKVRDLRLRYGAPEVFAAQCSCGWMGGECRGQYAQGNAQLDGARHRDAQQPARRIGAQQR